MWMPAGTDGRIHLMSLGRNTLTALLAAFLAIAPAMGCGKKAPPFLPAKKTDKVFESFTANPARGGVMVVWTEAAKLPKPGKGVKWTGYSLSRKEQGGEAQVIRTAEPTSGGGRFEHLDLKAGKGKTYVYAVTLASADGQLTFATPGIEVAAGGGPAPPGAPRAEPGDGQVAVSWRAVPAAGPESVPGAYNVFRREKKGDFDATAPLNPKPLAGDSFLDRTAANDKEYCYALTVMFKGKEGVDESPFSPETCAASRDKTPPAAPAGLRVTVREGAVFLSWRDNEESDLAGYRVYRRRGAEEAFALRTASPVISAQFRDQDVSPGQEYFYAVTAVDGADPPNESPYSEVIKALP